ncbi:hypothetical protein BGZ70_001682 [Mortierella alpina]|uniref:Uncharacterized protein n=1 Tax=Mortierella alpina TaxID=64518 RepID=A0A9P6JBP7_MORAP|nr:hypothetical protein BGZ70_001682 [Mortierella alpina]
MESQHVINPWQHRTHKESLDPLGGTHHDLETSAAFDGLFQDPKEVFYHSQRLLHHLQARQQQHKDYEHDHALTRESEDDETASQDTAWSRLGMDSPLNLSSSTLGDTAAVVFSLESSIEPEGDILQHLVHTLQSEVKDSQATVYELESRLNMAEHSNRLIVEELKTLLARQVHLQPLTISPSSDILSFVE